MVSEPAPLMPAYSVYIPQVFNSPHPTFGVQIDGPLTIPVTSPRFYHTNIRWMDEPPYWRNNVASFGSNPYILDFKCPPPEHRLWADRPGSPPKPESYAACRDFIKQCISDLHPWGVEYFNEPAVDKNLGYDPNLPPDQQTYDLQLYYGAWVENEDYTQAGHRYGEALAVASPAIRERGAKVVGGVLLDDGDSQLKFLSALLSRCEPDYVSFHCYLYLGEAYDKIFRYIDRIRSIAGNLPLICTETSVITGYDEAPDSPELQQAQLEYCQYLRENCPIPWLWYSQDGNWRQCGLTRHGYITPAYYCWSSDSSA